MTVQALDIADQLAETGGFDKRQAEAIGRVLARSFESEGKGYATAAQLENVETRLTARIDGIEAHIDGVEVRMESMELRLEGQIERSKSELQAAIARQGRLLIVSAIGILGGVIAFIQFLA